MNSRIASYRNEIKFVALFVLFFIVGQTFHIVSRPYIAPVYVNLLNAKMSAVLINVFTPGEKVLSEGSKITSDNATITVEEGCEGIEGIILFLAAVFAYKALKKEKVLGIIVGSIVLHLANITRLVSLYYVLRFKPAIFDVMHIFVGQTYIIFICLILFIGWIQFGTRQS